MRRVTLGGTGMARFWVATVLLLLSSTGSAVGQAAGDAAAQAVPRSLQIVILDGDNALNNIRQREAREPVVEVQDENHKPVSGVAVLFLIHEGPNGAGATFGGQSTSLSVTTGTDGIAHASGLQLTQSPGSFTIAVTATLGSLVAATTIHQSSVLSPLSSTTSQIAPSVAHHAILGLSKTVVIALGSAIVAGTVIGVVAATRDNGGTSLKLGQGTVTQ